MILMHLLLGIIHKSSFTSSLYAYGHIPSYREKLMTKKWVGVDMLYHNEKYEGQINRTLTIFLRVMKKKPILKGGQPAKKTVKEKDASNVPNGVPASWI